MNEDMVSCVSFHMFRSLFWEEQMQVVEYDPTDQSQLQFLHIPQYSLSPDIEKKLLDGFFDTRLKRGLSAVCPSVELVLVSRILTPKFTFSRTSAA